MEKNTAVTAPSKLYDFNGREPVRPTFAADQSEPLKGRRLYQIPKDPIQDEADEAWQAMLARFDKAKLKANPTQVITAVQETAKQAEKNNALTWLDDLKGHTQNWLIKLKCALRGGLEFLRDIGWLTGIVTDASMIEAIFRVQQLPDEAREIKRRIIDFDRKEHLHCRRLRSKVKQIVRENHLSSVEIDWMSLVVEGKMILDEPRIIKASEQWREFTGEVHGLLSAAGVLFSVWRNGAEMGVGYWAIEKDPYYWPHLYDWNSKMVLGTC